MWVSWSCFGNGTFDGEKSDLMQRKDFLVSKIAVELM